mmetsp:Transcript_10488/g.15247  ORF Transcript_10488/g.15247 Transcript_10488/m.15247 type:complete len:122 (-) Transcript_10488:1868-2233(-)
MYSPINHSSIIRAFALREVGVGTPLPMLLCLDRGVLTLEEPALVPEYARGDNIPLARRALAEVGVERPDAAVGVERPDAAVGVERPDAAVGVERPDAAVGVIRPLAIVGIESALLVEAALL